VSDNNGYTKVIQSFQYLQKIDLEAWKSKNIFLGKKKVPNDQAHPLLHKIAVRNHNSKKKLSEVLTFRCFYFPPGFL
jgi:hypothetical protein